MTESGVEVSLEKVAFGYAQARVRFDVRFKPGAITAITGPSGSGKTTMLNLIAGFEIPASGLVRIAEEDVTKLAPSKRPVSFLFQENNLFSHLSVRGNVGLGISPSLRLSQEEDGRVTAALERVGIADKQKRLPEELSGGERQRAAIARVLVQDRPLLLMDEPFASLGPSLRQEMTLLAGELQREHGMTMLIVTHHPAEAAGISSELCFVEGGEVKALGSARELLAGAGPASLREYLGAPPQIR